MNHHPIKYTVTEKQFEALLVIAIEFMWANPYPTKVEKK